MKNTIAAGSILVLLTATLVAQQRPPALPEKRAAETEKFTRFVKTGKNEGRLETAIVRYEDAEGRIVDLVGAVHIGDPSYYRRLQKAFKQYDSLLYELVAPKNTRPRRGQKSSGMVSTIQRMMKKVLELEFQLDGIDYSAENFVHADLSPERFAELQKKRGESMFSMIINSFIEQMKRMDSTAGQDISMIRMVAALFKEDRARHMKLIFAEQMDDIEAMLAGFGGDKGSRSVIIGDRNKEAMRVLREQLEKGNDKVGIFYGAAHLPDFEDRLKKMGFKPKKRKWLTAWDLADPTKKKEKKTPKKKRKTREI